MTNVTTVTTVPGVSSWPNATKTAAVPATTRVGYVCKMFPRFSETFILNEILELERQSADLHSFILKTNNEGRFHADTARLRAPVTHAPQAV